MFSSARINSDQKYQPEELEQNVEDFEEFIALKGNRRSESNSALSQDNKTALDLVQVQDLDYGLKNFARSINIEHGNRIKRADSDEAGPSPAKKIKAEGVERGGPGLDYQVQLSMYFARQGYELNKQQPDYSFELGKERMEAGKFDDIIVRYKQKIDPNWNYLLLQSKYTQDKITTGKLLSSDNTASFTLIKYFSSYIKSKEYYKKETESNGIESCVIVTNNDFKYDQNIDNKLKPANAERGKAGTGGRGQNFYLEEFSPNEILKVQGAPQAKYLKFDSKHKDKIVEELKKAFKENYNKTENDKKVMGKDVDKEIIENLKGIIDNDQKFIAELNEFVDKLLFIVNLPDRQKIRSIIKEKIGEEFLLLNDSIIDQFNRDMFDYIINKDRKKFLSGKKIEEFFNKMKTTINTHKIQSNYYLKIVDSVIDFKSEIKNKIDCNNFLSIPERNNKNIFLLKTDSVFLTTVKMYIILQDSSLKQYKYNDKHTFLSLKELKSTTLKTNVMNSFRDEHGFNLLVIVFDEPHNPKEQDLQRELCKNINNNKKIIFITPKDFKLDNSLNDKKFNANENTDEDNDINFKDLTDLSKKLLLDKTVMFQGEDIRLKQLYFELEVDEPLSPEQLNQLNIDTKTLEDLEESDPIEIKKPLSLSDLEGAYSKFYEEINERVLVENPILQDDVFVISGIAKDQILKILEDSILDNKKETIDNIKSKISDGKISDGKIILRNQQFIEENFKQLCHNNSDKEIYWINYKSNKFILQHFYNPNFYLNRKFNYPEKIIIENNIKEELSKDNPKSLFLFTGVDKKENLLEILELNDQQKNAVQQNIKDDKIVIKKENGQEEFDELIKDNSESIHWLHVEDNNGDKQIIWRKSHRSLENLRDSTHVEKIVIDSDKKLIDKIKDNKAALIIDKPGMGKSTTLVSVSHKMLESYWIIHINLRDYKKAIQNLPENINNINAVLNFLSETKNLNIPLEKDLARYKLEYQGGAKPLRLLFDGFDEIKSDSTENIEKTKVSSLLKFLKEHTPSTVWVTARQHDAPILQDSLSVFGIGFEAFTPSMQEEYFKDVWRNHLKFSFNQNELDKIFIFDSENKNIKFQEYYKTLSKAMTQVLQEEDSSFMGIPLTLRLFAESFRGKFKRFIKDGPQDFQKDFDKLSILTLYQYFIDEKFEILFREKTNLSDGFNKISKDWFKESLIKKHQRLAFQELFSNKLTKKFLGIKSPFLTIEDSVKINSAELEELLRLGLVQSIQGDHFEFIHRTFAEYFVAKLFVYMVNNKKKSNLEKYNQVYEFLNKEIFKEQYTVIYKFLDAMAQEDNTKEWHCQWENIVSIKKGNLLGKETSINELIWDTQLSSDESLSDLRQKVEDLIIWSFYVENKYKYNFKKDQEGKNVENLFKKFIVETNIEELKSTLDLWQKMYILRTNTSEVNAIIDRNLYHVIQHYVTQAQQQNQQPDLEFIKSEYKNSQSIRITIIEKYNNIDNINDLEEEDLVEKINEIFKQKNYDFKWLETHGIEIVISCKLLTPDMSKVFNSVLQGVTKNNRLYTYYVNMIYDKLILPILRFLSYDDNKKLYKIEVSAFLNIFQSFSHFSSQLEIPLYLFESDFKVLLKNIENVMQPENVSQENLFYGIESLRALRTWEFRLTQGSNNLYLKYGGNDYIHALKLQYKKKIESLLLFRLKNPQNDQGFFKECKEASDSIQHLVRESDHRENIV